MARRNQDDGNSFLMGGEQIPSCSFLTKGTVHEGEILSYDTRQQTDPKTREARFWKNGDPMMQLVITLQTDEYDDEIEDDDGRRRLYVKYKMKDAISDAVREADVDGIEIGGYLKVKFTKQDKPEKRSLSGTKHFAAKYEPPDPNAAANTFLDSEDPDEDDDDDIDEPPAKPARKSPAKKTARKTASRGRSRVADDDESDDSDDDDEPAQRPARGRRAAAKKTSGRSRRSEYVEDDDDEDSF